MIDLKVETIDESDPKTNMYGCLPCPKCKDRFRWPDNENIIRCDACGYLAKWIRKEESV